MKTLIVVSVLVLVVSLLHGFNFWLLLRNAVLLGAVVLALIKLVLTQHDKKTTEESARVEKWAEENKIVIDKERVKPESFKVQYDQSEWDTLVKKLELTRYHEAMSDKYVPKYEYGFDPEYAKELVDYWKSKFDWRAQVDKLNRYPQFRIRVNDVTIHYVKYKTNSDKGLESIPVILMDGWPGHFFGFYKMIDELESKYKDMSFDIIVPSYPGLGFSNPLYKPITSCDTAMLLDAIMRYYHGDNCRYMLHGEDWGSSITTNLAKLYPNRVKALHTTLPFSTTVLKDPTSVLQLAVAHIMPSLILSKEELERNIMYKFAVYFKWMIVNGGYFHLQATKPDSFGFGLTDSPVGLMAYVLEKYALGSFGYQAYGTRDAMLGKLDRDDLLTIVMYYWTSNSINSANRFYKHNFYSNDYPRRAVNDLRVTEKVAVAIQYFKNEIQTFPSKVLKNSYLGLKRYTIETKGGHFASFENPELCAKDFAEFVKSIL